MVTDVVRENNQTYRLGWTEQCKDGTKMGVGCPEYILLFRKLPTDHSKAYADEPVTKSKDISIHAPTNGATPYTPFTTAEQLKFQSTLRRTERQMIKCVKFLIRYFNPRSDERSDTSNKSA